MLTRIMKHRDDREAGFTLIELFNAPDREVVVEEVVVIQS